jgi:hypothetical protein
MQARIKADRVLIASIDGFDDLCEDASRVFETSLE